MKVDVELALSSPGKGVLLKSMGRVLYLISVMAFLTERKG